MNKIMINKKIMIGGVIVLVVALIATWGFLSSKSELEVTKVKDQEFSEASDDLMAIPTVTSDVKVSLESVNPKKVIKFVVEGVPPGTKSIEYELTYSTKDQDSQGVFSTAKPDKGDSTFGSDFEREITLGTCSKNVCKYHDITSDIAVSLKFEGSYGARIFNKSYKTASLW